MKLKFLTIIITILLCSIVTFGQSELEVANQRLDKTISLLTAEQANSKNLESQIEVLKLRIEKLEASKDTPCSTAIKAATTDLVFWHSQLESANDKTFKQVAKTLKERRKFNSKSVASQCGFDNKSKSTIFLGYLKDFAPTLAILLLKR